METNKVLVLMSTYNGESYLCEQIDSILKQINVDVQLLIRDDGSIDNTLLILNKYKFYDNISVLFENNIGAEKSFHKLAEYASKSDFKYFAFADQDDYWLENKLSTAISKLNSEEDDIALMYCSNLDVVDKELKHLFYMNQNKNISINKKTALVQNFATGCTIVFNRNALDLILRYEPKHSTLHDYWLYLLCIYLGKVIYDEKSYILYRQHGNNAVGMENNLKSIWKKRLKSFKRLDEHPREYRAQDLLSGYLDLLQSDDINTIRIVADYRKNIINKFRFFFNHKIHMGNIERDFWLRIRILSNSV